MPAGCLLPVAKKMFKRCKPTKAGSTPPPVVPGAAPALAKAGVGGYIYIYIYILRIIYVYVYIYIYVHMYVYIYIYYTHLQYLYSIDLCIYNPRIDPKLS